MRKHSRVHILRGFCPMCRGDLYLDYKGGRLIKCCRCSRIFLPSYIRRIARKMPAKRG